MSSPGVRQPRRPRLVAGAFAGLVALWIAWPYVTGTLVSGNVAEDAVSYHLVAADAIQQAHHGIFPPYVAQSAYRYNGGDYPQAQSPALGLLVVALDQAGRGRFSSVQCLNGALVLALVTGALAMSWALERASGRPWLAAWGAVAYVACPGVLGILVRLDMYSSVLALPLLPVLWDAALGLWRSEGLPAACRAGAVLALLWMTHAPIALWASVAVALTVAVGLARRNIRPATIVALAAVGLGAGAWYLTTLVSLGAHQAEDVGLEATVPVDDILRNVSADWPSSLLPVGWAQGGTGNPWLVAEWPAWWPPAWRVAGGTPYLQLGYALWTALLWATSQAWARRDTLLALLCGCGWGLVMLLLPIPGLTRALWSSLPAIFSITRAWPMQRLYVVLAALTALAGALAARRYLEAHPRRLAPLAAVASILLAWSLAEASKMRAFALSRRAIPVVQRDVLSPENAPLKRKDMQMGATRFLPVFGDPGLAPRLLDAGGRVVADNAAVVRRLCEAASYTRVAHLGGLQDLALITVRPGEHLAACLATTRDLWLQAADEQGYRRRLLPRQSEVPPPGPHVLPLFTTGRTERVVHLTLGMAGDPPDQPGDVHAFATVAYAPAELPVRLLGLLPELVLEVAAATPGLALETSRLHRPGYVAAVNGRAVPPGRSPDGYVTVPLWPGRNVVELRYVGTWAMRAALWVSVLAMLVAAALQLRGLVPK